MQSPSFTENPAPPRSRIRLLLPALLIVTAVAGWRFFQHAETLGYPDDEASVEVWICEKCAVEVKLTPRKRHEWMNSRDRLWRDPDAPRKQPVFWCDACRAYTVCGAEFCQRHQIHYLAIDHTGQLHDCPKCTEEWRRGSEEQAQ